MRIEKCNKNEQDYIIDRFVEYNLSQVAAKQEKLFIDLSGKIVDGDKTMGFGILEISSVSLVVSGFHLIFGIHHDSQLNACNLADDLIEPYRAVDIVAHDNIGSNVQLSKNERRAIAHVLHNACMINEMKVNVLSAIDITVESLKRIILDKSDEKLMLPAVLPIESMEGITE